MRPLNCGVMRHMASETQHDPLLAPQKPRRPLLLGLFAALLTAQAAILPILAVGSLLSASDSVVAYNGVEVPAGEVRLLELGAFALWFIFAVYVGPGLWRGIAMARRVFFATSVVAAVVGVATTIVVYQGKSGLFVAAGYVGISNLVGCGVVGWYLYIKPNVRAFFERKSSRTANAA